MPENESVKVNPSSELLGSTELGFDQSKLDRLIQDKQKAEDRLTRLTQLYALALDDKNKRILQRQSLIAAGESNDSIRSRRRLTGPNAMPGLTTSADIERENEERLQSAELEFQQQRLLLVPEIKSLAFQIDEEADKRTDNLDLNEVYAELENAKSLPEVKVTLKNLRGVLSANVSLDFTQPEASENDASWSSEVEANVESEVWFHTTRHLVNMIESGGIATQSWLQNHDPHYFDTLVQNSTTVGSLDQDMSVNSPMGRWDTDKLYFRANTVENYGGYIIAYDPAATFVDSGLFVVPEGIVHDAERIVSDVADPSKDQLSQSGKSNLQLAFDKAWLAVPRSEYRKICQLLLTHGYSREWIEERVLSYRGQGETTSEGRRIGADEIKQRVAKRRAAENKPDVHLVPNPLKAGSAKVWQFERPDKTKLVTADSQINDEVVTEGMKPEEIISVAMGEQMVPYQLLYRLEADPELSELFQAYAGVMEGYTIHQHVEMVLTQFERYFAGSMEPVPRLFIRLMLAVHDMGKSLVDPSKTTADNESGRALDQHALTIPIAKRVFEQLGFPPEVIQLAISLIDQDYIGMMLKGKYKHQDPTLSSVAEEIRKAATSHGLKPDQYLELLRIFYLCDAGSYTSDTRELGSKAFLDKYFEFDREKNKMDFSSNSLDVINGKTPKMYFEELKAAVLNHETL